MSDTVALHYDLHLMPRGRYPFRRWHWELWHGATLLAAGWQADRLQAQRTVRVHAVRVAHRLRGLRVLHPEAAHPEETPWHGPVTIHWGEMAIELLPTGEEHRRFQSASAAH